MADNNSSKSSSISGSDYSDFEASMEGDYSERGYKLFGEIRHSRFTQPERIYSKAREEEEEEPRPPQSRKREWLVHLRL